MERKQDETAQMTIKITETLVKWYGEVYFGCFGFLTY
jgi:hypothetical protein